MVRIKQLWTDKLLESSRQETAAWLTRNRKDNFGKEHKNKSNKSGSGIKSLIVGAAFSHLKAAVGSSEMMEVNISHLTLFTDPSKNFVILLRICRPQADVL